MLVALYNRTFDAADAPILIRILKLLEEHKLQMVFYKEFYERLLPFMDAPAPRALLYPARKTCPRRRTCSSAWGAMAPCWMRYAL